MPARKTAGKMHIEYHRDGSIWAKGRMIDSVPEGYWEWFRTDGSRMRSGNFKRGRQIGEWTTYDRKGRTVKVTEIKTAAKDLGRVHKKYT